MSVTRYLSLCGLVMLLALVLTAFGCGPGQKDRARVKGKVTVKGGEPVTMGTVTFSSKDGKRSGSSSIDANGLYDMSDAPIGEVDVTITTPTQSGAAKMKGMAGMPGGLMNKPADTTKPSQKLPEGFDAAKMKVPEMPEKLVGVDEKYSKVGESGLSYKVEKGEHTHNIELP
jgi:hypothetical protein